MSTSSLKNSIFLLLDASKQRVDVKTKFNVKGEYRFLPLDLLEAGSFQPRKIFNDQPLQELANSIRMEGILQPLIVRPLSNGKYEIIAGERRYRAAKIAGLIEVPAIIREICDESALAFGILENLQREDLNPIEEAEAYKKLVDDFSLTHEEISNKVGKSRPYISNLLRLLKLPKNIQEALSENVIQTGHAKLILSLDHEKIEEIFQKLVQNKLTVRQLEKLTNKIEAIKKLPGPILLSQNTYNLENNVSKLFNAECKIKLDLKGRAKILLTCENLSNFETIIKLILEKLK